MSVTMADVAKLAGVNKATVSRALKGDHRISPATRDKVWKAAKALGYEPDAVASGLSSHRTNLIGVVLPDLALSGTGQFLAGLERVFSRHKLDFLVKSTSLVGEHEGNIIRNMRSRKVDGIIWFGGSNSVGGLDIPLISIGPRCTATSSIVLDIEKTMKKLASIKGKGGEILCYGENIALYSELIKQISPPLKVISAKEFADVTPTTSAVVCTDRTIAELAGVHCLVMPLFEMGAIAGRVMLNALGSKGIIPSKILIAPLLLSPTGDIVD